jgi:HipA-like protein
MARQMAYKPLNVFLNGRLVGLLRREASGAIDFQYAQDWLDFRGTLPVSLSTLRPAVDKRRSPASPASGGLLPGAFGPKHPQVPVRWGA